MTAVLALDVVERMSARIAAASVASLSDAPAAAEAIVRRMSATERSTAAMLYVATEIRRAHRARVLEAEREAEATPDARQARAGARLEQEAEREEWRTKRTAGMFRAIQDSLELYAAEMQIQWTRELLGSEFALADGTHVTWGSATVAQHEARQQMLTRNAAANAEAASRHARAVSDIRACGAECLNEITVAA